MDDLVRKLEKERQKLNELGEKSLMQSIPLSDNQEVQEQSRRVDELMVQYQRMKAKDRQPIR
ncbi:MULTISPECIES: aspartyl-phosphate phosphatase Spo0E family protein [Paenibacillaceae]|uniref:Aspartyl-phosphate phosphatase Spo0E family protein n=1 Tax=Paenibacillus woosongensis TaxID=307580 RepID=A0AA95ID32_9BACL|nr:MULTISPECIES: aspartyl-phosphate phosphatase Spo0E family protein [Paenibacillaceae]MDU5144655.1 aspartyl-phosphate phosphatase Spo0E family protein [Paenibacillus dendritiformis]MBS5910689.1 Spo0E family sporulation regulatory protein-aspartic acid phosphatase [Paenibacillus macerans]MDU5947777.1 aspartyl-phosphate phosphatase Spo0E family protein [Paenibacillus macerans]MDU7472272.1 aspartyl-phosphate phosphatase Spo0E family protein [Paenibacillus macerans]MEC0136962.1 aspartyl-phosphate